MTIGGPTQLAATATLLTVVAFFALDELVDLPTWVWPVGIAIAWAGIALRLWAVSTLGSQFSRVVRVEAGGHVEQRGPYRYVRHPSYSAVRLAFAGIGIAQANVLSAVGAIVCILVGYAARIRVEEEVLEAELGDAYRDYASTRARLVPGVG